VNVFLAATPFFGEALLKDELFVFWLAKPLFGMPLAIVVVSN
jgi:hypothetical protein